MTRRHLGLIVGVAALAWIVGAAGGLYPHPTISDIPVYERASDRMLDGLVPYRDFALEYPPLAAALFAFAGLLPGPFAVGFSVLMLVALCVAAAGVFATARALGLTERRALAGALVMAALPVILGEFVQTRFDIVVAALLAWTAWAAATRRFAPMWALLAAAVAVKLVPIVLVPILVAWHLHHRPAAVVGRHVGAAAGAVVATYLPFLALSAGGVWDMFQYHLDRPLQIESLGSSLLIAADRLFDVGVTVESSFGSQNLVAPGRDAAAAVSAALAVVGIAALLVTTARLLRRGAGAPAVIGACAATLVLTVALGKVLSPQFLVWVVPLVLVLPGARGRAAFATAIAALAVTQMYFPVRYWDLVALDGFPTAVLVLRNVLLMALVALTWPRLSAASPEPSLQRGGSGQPSAGIEKVSMRVARPSGAASMTAP